MIKKFLLLSTAVMLTGCAGGIAGFYDRQDPCQNRPELNRPPGYQIPTWCGASAARATIYNQRGQAIGFIR